MFLCTERNLYIYIFCFYFYLFFNMYRFIEVFRNKLREPFLDLFHMPSGTLKISNSLHLAIFVVIESNNKLIPCYSK